MLPKAVGKTQPGKTNQKLSTLDETIPEIECRAIHRMRLIGVDDITGDDIIETVTRAHQTVPLNPVPIDKREGRGKMSGGVGQIVSPVNRNSSLAERETLRQPEKSVAPMARTGRCLPEMMKTVDRGGYSLWSRSKKRSQRTNPKAF